MQLYATIRKSSKYAHQQPRDTSQRSAPPRPFAVEIVGGYDEYCVEGNSNMYRIADVRFYAKRDDRFIALTR